MCCFDTKSSLSLTICYLQGGNGLVFSAFLWASHLPSVLAPSRMFWKSLCFNIILCLCFKK